MLPVAYPMLDRMGERDNMKTILTSLLLTLSVMTMSAQTPKGHGNRYDNQREHVARHDTDRHEYERRMRDAATPEQVKAIVKLIKDTSFDDHKFEVAKVCLELREVPVEGIRKMVKCFSFDDNKVEFLKYAYRYCPDRENYFTLAKELTFSSSQNELLKYIEKHR